MDRTVRWGVCDTKDSCGTVFSALRGLELRCRVVVRDGKDISGVDEVNESDTIVVVDVERKMTDGYIVRRCSTDEV